MKCYYLLDNTQQRDTTVVISEEMEQVTYQFMISRCSVDTPPSTPLLPDDLASMKAELEAQGMAVGKGCPMFMTPDLNVIKPTPTSTPNPTPPSSRKSSYAEDPDGATPFCPFQCIVASEETDSGLPAEDGHYHIPTLFMASMRNTSMSPLREDLDEEETSTTANKKTVVTVVPVNEEEATTATNADEGIVMRKISDISNSSTGSGVNEQSGAEAQSSSSKLPSRKISDISNHSGESGIDSTTSKVSDISKDGLPFDRDTSKQSLSSGVERKLSNTSSNGSAAEDELTLIRHTRAGSVSRTIEKYDSLTRMRRSGLPTVENGQPVTDQWDDNVIHSVSSASV